MDLAEEKSFRIRWPRGKYLLIALSVFVVVVSSVVTWYLLSGLESPPTFEDVPDGQRTFYSYDGPVGDFHVDVVRVDGTVELSWDRDVRVLDLIVYNLGQLDNPDDHFVQFQLKAYREHEGGLSQLPNPYRVGEIPPEHHDLTPDEVKESSNSVFEEGTRYSIEISGQDGAGDYVISTYTFTYGEELHE